MNKFLITSAFLLFSFCLSAQPYFLLQYNSAKEFAPFTETWERNYTLKLDSAYIGNVITMHYVHSVMNLSEDFDFGEETPEECFGWGGCYSHTGSAGFGSTIFSPVPFAYNFYTLGGDTLHLNFLVDSSAFYQNDDEFFSLVYEGESEQLVFGTPEMVQRYRVGHYATDGTPLMTPLHESAVTVGETTGLIDFFQIDEFPQMEMPLTLIGEGMHDESLQALTSEDIYDFQVGDTIQYKVSYSESEPGNPDYILDVSYLNRIFLGRIDEADSLRYTVLYQSFVQDETDVEEWTEELVYYRFDTLASMPFYQRRNDDEGLAGSFQEHLFSRNFCGETRLGLRGVSAPFSRCQDYDAWCGFDTNGPPAITTYEYVPGLGQYFHEVARNGFGTFNSWREATEVVYFSKGSNSCGQEAILSNRDQDRPQIDFTIFPNPSDDVINVRISPETKSKLSKLNILDMSGRTVISYTWQGLEIGTVDVSKLASGVYLLQVLGSDGVMGAETFVVQ